MLTPTHTQESKLMNYTVIKTTISLNLGPATTNLLPLPLLTGTNTQCRYVLRRTLAHVVAEDRSLCFLLQIE